MEIADKRAPREGGMYSQMYVSDAELANVARRRDVEAYVYTRLADLMVEEIWRERRHVLLEAISSERINALVEEALRERLKKTMNFEVKL
jgi:hypothetical protein